jgi:hypothetical protein
MESQSSAILKKHYNKLWNYSIMYYEVSYKQGMRLNERYKHSF